jgi:hypothetical protein
MKFPLSEPQIRADERMKHDAPRPPDSEQSRLGQAPTYLLRDLCGTKDVLHLLKILLSACICGSDIY